jgi:hypothetical protein
MLDWYERVVSAERMINCQISQKIILKRGFFFCFDFIVANILTSIKGQRGTWSLISTGQNIDWEQHETKL